MIRGCQRKILMLKNTESPLFEEAYFILRSDGTALPTSARSNMIKEANRIIAENLIACGSSSPAFDHIKPRKLRRSGKLQAAIWFLSGLAAGGAALGLFSLIF